MTYQIDKNFIFGLRKMVSKKSESFQDEFFRRIHVINEYTNLAGSAFDDFNTASNVALQMELENVWGEEEVNI